MTTTEIAAEHGVSRQTIHTYRRTGVFPQPVEGQGSTRPRFREDEVAAFFEANPKQPRKKRRPQQQGAPVTTTVDARRNLYAFVMQGKEHSPDISERASAEIDAFRAAVLREAADSVSDMPAPDCSDFSDLDEAWESGASAAARRLRDQADELAEES
ncbi:helix-turn-helix domain-containing protein [Streptomyces stelliscabiei]|uniref:helix-turn-helix transcriptional regulator n=1 Tax=Streptomyces stelliscabiei TaxID=146820 RepID=UPI0029A57E14|nr:helix-turn-helix domain-containing protein [Streptomyces stelliscabiei]MDX2513867.1 helix-turn-helix domain-containing protein [Streptomyces stelliscabiei]